MFGPPDRFLNINNDTSNYLEEDELELRRMKSKAKKRRRKSIYSNGYK